MAIISGSITLIKKNRIAVISVLAFVVALCCVFVFAGNNSEDTSLGGESSVLDNSSTSNDVVGGYGIYIDGYFIAAASSMEDAENAVNNALGVRVSSLNIDTNAKNSFANTINYIQGDYSSASFVDISSLLGENVTNYSGELLPIYLSVKSVTTYCENVVLEHETKTVYTDSMRDGATRVVTEGFDGEGKQTYEIVYIDGVESERNEVSLEVITPAVTEELRVGSRSDGKVTASVGNFIKPYDGFITSYMGARWGRTHQGIDIAQYGGCFRDPALAACDGVVINASNNGDGYGNCVIIDHGNGVKTLYAHLDEFAVEVDDIVYAGDVIGLIGNTGNSFGPHLHFEVRIDDVPVNPLMFVDYD